MHERQSELEEGGGWRRAALPFTLKPAPLLPALHNGKLEKNKWRERERGRRGWGGGRGSLSPAGERVRSEDRGGETQLPNYGCVMFSEEGDELRLDSRVVGVERGSG